MHQSAAVEATRRITAITIRRAHLLQRDVRRALADTAMPFRRRACATHLPGLRRTAACSQPDSQNDSEQSDG